MAMRLQDFIIGMAMFSLVVIGFTLYIGDLEENYPVESDPAFEDTFNKIANVTKASKDLEDKILKESDVSVISALTDAFSGALEAVRSLSISFSLVSEVIGAFGVALNIDPIFAAGIIVVLSMVLVFLVIAFIRGSVGGLA